MAAIKKGVKKKEHEKLDDATIERVITLLNDPKPITKKVLRDDDRAHRVPQG